MNSLEISLVRPDRRHLHRGDGGHLGQLDLYPGGLHVTGGYEGRGVGFSRADDVVNGKLWTVLAHVTTVHCGGLR